MGDKACGVDLHKRFFVACIMGKEARVEEVRGKGRIATVVAVIIAFVFRLARLKWSGEVGDEVCYDLAHDFLTAKATQAGGVPCYANPA